MKKEEIKNFLESVEVEAETAEEIGAEGFDYKKLGSNAALAHCDLLLVDSHVYALDRKEVIFNAFADSIGGTLDQPLNKKMLDKMLSHNNLLDVCSCHALIKGGNQPNAVSNHINFLNSLSKMTEYLYKNLYKSVREIHPFEQ